MPNFISTDKGAFKLSDDPIEAQAQVDFCKVSTLEDILASGIKRWNMAENKEV